jgi:hypothetical protein
MSAAKINTAWGVTALHDAGFLSDSPYSDVYACLFDAVEAARPDKDPHWWGDTVNELHSDVIAAARIAERDADDADDGGESERERVIGMAHGNRGLADYGGLDTAPDECGHQCDDDCPRCGEDW